MGDEWTYCPRCGRIPVFDGCSCGYEKAYKIDSKWGINEQRYEELLVLCKYREITYKELVRRWITILTPFIEEVVSQSPEFDKALYAQVLEKKQRWAEQQDQIVENMKRQAAAEAACPKITCPYCKSTNTKKLSSLSRALSAGIFGLGSSKIGKQWHCNSCGSDF